MSNNQTLTVLNIQASARRAGSITRDLSDSFLADLQQRHSSLRVITRDVADGLPLVTERWVQANFTPEADRTAEQRETLALSDSLIDELEAADLIVIGAPMYNFGVPAALKAWIDLVARARKTFEYTANGPKGLLQGKRAVIITATGGVPVNAEVDFATPYLRHALAFIGITDVDLIAAERVTVDADAAGRAKLETKTLATRIAA
ncbi:MAG: NAD(P)H-dependent oxidoreductase [Pseudomonadota bacterium]